MATQTFVTLICDGCGAEGGDVETRDLRGLEGEACAACWSPVAELIGRWSPRRRRRSRP